MLRFLEMVLRDIKAGGFCQQQADLQYFFLEMLANFAPALSYCLFDEAFIVFDKLLAMCSDVINEKVLTRCILALVDKYTMKSKSQKISQTAFMKMLMEVKVRPAKPGQPRSNNNATDSDGDHDQVAVTSKNNYFEIMCSFCFFNNTEDAKSISDPFRSPADAHDLFIDKLQFFIDSLAMLTDMHQTLFTWMIMHPRFKQCVLALLSKGELALRLKCHELLEVVTNYFH